MSELDPKGVEAAATAIVGAEVGYEMKLSRLVDGVSTYTLKLETGEQFEFGNTDEVYEKIAGEKAKRQAEAAITAYLSTVSPFSDGDGWSVNAQAIINLSRILGKAVLAGDKLRIDRLREALDVLEEEFPEALSQVNARYPIYPRDEVA